MCLPPNHDLLMPLSAAAAGGADTARPAGARRHRRSTGDGEPAPVRLGGVAYELGEHDLGYTQLPDVAATLQRLGLADEPQLWGFGRYRRSGRETAELALDSARRTLQRAGAAPQDVDAVLLCSVAFPAGVRAHRALTHAVLRGLQMADDTPLLGVTISRCATLLCGIRLADDLLASGRYRTILVVSCDRITDERERLEPFAIFSDAAASCLLSREAMPGYEVVHTVQASCATAADSDGPDAGGRLAARANRALSQALIAPGSLRRVLHDNLFKPIVALREQLAGFERSQLYLDNIGAIGHCFACDPLINLADLEAAAPPEPGALLGLFSGTPGVRSGVVLRVPAASQRH